MEYQRRASAREVLMQGATQIKVLAGGGIVSIYDPIDVREYSLEEMKAFVDAADAWNTYVMVHAYTPAAIRMSLEAGVKSVEYPSWSSGLFSPFAAIAHKRVGAY